MSGSIIVHSLTIPLPPAEPPPSHVRASVMTSPVSSTVVSSTTVLRGVFGMPIPTSSPSLRPHIPRLTHSDMLLLRREISVSGDILRMNEMYISISLSSLVCAVSLVEVFQYSCTLAGRFQLNMEATDVNRGQFCEDLSIQVETLTIEAMPSSPDIITATLPENATAQSSPSNECASPLPLACMDTKALTVLPQCEFPVGAETGFTKHRQSGIFTQDSGLGLQDTCFKDYLHSGVSYMFSFTLSLA